MYLSRKKQIALALIIMEAAGHKDQQKKKKKGLEELEDCSRNNN